MNREQRRQSLKNDERLVVSRIEVTFENGQVVNLDPGKVNIVDRETKANLFQAVMEPVPGQVPGTTVNVDKVEEAPDSESFSVEFDTPEGRMEYVKNGNWSGVRPVKG